MTEEHLEKILKEKSQKTCLEKYGCISYPFFKHVTHTSKCQNEIADFLKTNFENLEVKLNVKGLFKENKFLEVDIWIPKIKFGIEYNGIYWHDKNLYLSDLKENTFNSKEHLKDLYSTLNNFTLLQIWEDDFLNQKEKFKEAIFKIVSERLTELQNGI